MKKKLIALGLEKLQALCTENQIEFSAKDKEAKLADFLIAADYELPEGAEGEEGDGEEATVVGEKEVSFRSFQDHKCKIGGKVIILEKDKVAKIPASAAVVLSGSKKGYQV